MNFKTKLLVFCCIFVLFNVAVVSASDVNLTDDNLLEVNDQYNDTAVSLSDNLDEINESCQQDNLAAPSESTNESNDVDSSNNVLGKNAVSPDEKLNSTITAVSTKVLKGTDFQIYLRDTNKNPISNVNVVFTLNGEKISSKTDANGLARLTMPTEVGSYQVGVSFKGNNKYNSVSRTIKVIVPIVATVTIGNDKLLTNGYLRIYLRSTHPSAVSNKVLHVVVGKKVFNVTTNKEGVAIFKPKAGKNTYLVTVIYEGTKYVTNTSHSKNVSGVVGNAKNPFKESVPLKNGKPDMDYMPAYYVWGDGNAKYTLLKEHYLEAIQRDSYCLFLKNKLTKYTIFRTKNEPNLYHMIIRTKWNVIEREINTIVVLQNQYKYWPKQVTVSLKGKAYNYPEVRDVQDTGYTCGPTSCSMCTQVLRAYANEAYLSAKAGTNSYDGSSTSGLKKALEKNNMKCTYYYKSSFNTALNELKKGGCALVFHTWGHYVAILDISADGKQVLVGNPSGDYDHGSHGIPTNWLTVDYMYSCFNDYDTSGLIVKLNYSLKQSVKNKINTFYSNTGKWSRTNTNERIPQI